MKNITKTRTRTYENVEGRRIFLFVFNSESMTPMVANNALDAQLGINTEIIDNLNKLAENLKNLGLENDNITNAINDTLRYMGYEELWSPEVATA